MLREALGRLVFVYGALAYDKPFLGPLFAFHELYPVWGGEETAVVRTCCAYRSDCMRLGPGDSLQRSIS